MEYLDPVSSDEEYFPTAEELELEDDEIMDSEEEDEERWRRRIRSRRPPMT